MTYRSFEEWAIAAQVEGRSLAQAILADEKELNEESEASIYKKMLQHWDVMQTSAKKALEEPQQMVGGLISGLAEKQNQYAQGETICGAVVNMAMAFALSSSEVNASMGRICAAPTAGACGVLPAVLLVLAKQKMSTEKNIADALLVAGGVGGLIMQNATVSGAEGGCQAECGAAAAMAAAAAVTLSGGDAEMVGEAISLTLMNCMGLVCDPVAGLVQIPCAFRNASQAVNALLSADLALAGQKAVIPADEAIDAMFAVGKSLPKELRETSLGGVAASATGQSIKKRLQETWQNSKGTY